MTLPLPPALTRPAVVAAAVAACTCVGRQRRSLRQMYGLEGDDTSDCLAAWCCLPCVMCQHARELKARGVFTHHQTPGGGVAPLPMPHLTY